VRVLDPHVTSGSRRIKLSQATSPANRPIFTAAPQFLRRANPRAVRRSAIVQTSARERFPLIWPVYWPPAFSIDRRRACTRNASRGMDCRTMPDARARLTRWFARSTADGKSAAAGRGAAHSIDQGMAWTRWCRRPRDAPHAFRAGARWPTATCSGSAVGRDKRIAPRCILRIEGIRKVGRQTFLSAMTVNVMHL